MTVHNILGPHYLEVVFQRALEVELKYLDLDFAREVDIPIYYREKR
jgi:GxxExxY protein